MRRGEAIGARATGRSATSSSAVVLAVLSIVFFGLSIIFPAVQVFGEDTPGARAFQGLTIVLWDASLVGIVYLLAKRKGGAWANLGWREPWDSEPWTFWKIARIGAAAYGASLAVLAVYNGLMTVAGLDDLLP